MVFPLSILRQKAQDSAADLPALKDAAQRVAAQILHGAHGQRKAGGHEKFWQFREYSESDRPQDIDWRQSAKTDHVYVREKELQTPQSVYFWSNRSASMDFQSSGALHSKSEAAQILSLALAMLYMRGDERVGYLGQRVGHSENAIEGIGRSLLEHDAAEHPEGSIPQKSTIVLASDFLSPLEDIDAAFAPLAGRNAHGVVIHILDIAERALPFNGHTVFEDGAQHRHKVDNVESIRAAYQDKISAHIEGLRKICASYGWTYVLHVTDTPLHETLQALWEEEQR